MQPLPTGVRPGTLVHARGAAWTVTGAVAFDQCALVSLEGRDTDNFGRRTRLLVPFDDLVPARCGTRVRRRRRQALARDILATVARARPPARLWTLAEARLDLLPWQLAPALGVVRGLTRVLLADAVGLGKTIQAGLILSELVARNLVHRTLVLTPPALRAVWADELHRRFDLHVAVLDQPSALERAARLPAGANPWSSDPIVVSSIDLVKRPEIRAAVADRPIDLLIVDEAHHVTPGTDRGDTVEQLASGVPWLVLASATPHAGDRHAYRYLLDLGRVAAGEPPMRVFRRAPIDVGLGHARRSHVTRVPPTSAEQRLQAGILSYAQAVRSGPHGRTPGVRLVASTLARRATSSALAAGRTLRRRLALLSGTAPPGEERQTVLPWAESDSDDLSPDAARLALPGLDDAAGERGWLERLVRDADEACLAPSKLARLERWLCRTGEPAIVFSEFRDTIDACLPVAARVRTVTCLHGGMDVPARARALSDFLDGRASVLLSTDVAGEGLNLQHDCRLVILIEWPWNPQRLEQRVGRVDRLGQTRRVHAVHLTSAGTFEETVVARLVGRSIRAARDLGDAVPALTAPVTERAVEAVVFAEAAIVDSAAPGGDAGGTRLEDEAADEAERARVCRRLSSLAGRGPAPTAGWSCVPRGTRIRRAAVVFTAIGHTATGRTDWDAVVALDVELVQPARTRAEWRAVVRFLAVDPRLREHARRVLPRSEPPFALIDRLRALKAAAVRRGRPEVQPSLFYRRASRRAEARADVAARLLDHLARTIEHVEAPSSRDTCELRLLAVLPLG